MNKTNPTAPKSGPIPRRNFLKTAALIGGGLTLVGCGKTTLPPPSATEAHPGNPVPPAGSPSPMPSPEFLPRIDGSFTSLPLPAPDLGGGLPLMQALALRESRRVYRGDELPLQILSEILWAAFGINRADKGLRTAPSAVNVQDIEIYLAAAPGLFRYDPKPHALAAVKPDDLRAATGTQDFPAGAPVNLIYVSNYGKLAPITIPELGADSSVAWAWTHTGFVSQNVYLYCASRGLATVVRAWVDRKPLAEKMGLAGDRYITMAQTVGYPG
jgi:nitroreductase